MKRYYIIEGDVTSVGGVVQRLQVVLRQQQYMTRL